MSEVLNVIAWVAACRKQNANTFRNTGAGHWLERALQIIEMQYAEIQAIRVECELAARCDGPSDLHFLATNVLAIIEGAK